MRDARKTIGTLIGVLGFIAAMAGLTYAMYVDTETNSNVIVGEHACEPIVNYTKGSDISLSNETGLKETTSTTYTENSAQTTLTFYAAEDCGTSIGTIYINISSVSSNYTTTSDAENVLFKKLRYTIVKNTSTPVTYTGSITQTGSTAVDVGTLETSTTTYTVYIWVEELDGEDDTPDPDISFTGYISASARQSSTFTD